VVALKKFCSFVVIPRVPLRKFFNETSSGRGGVEKQHAAGFVACILPGMRDVTRRERTGSRATDGYLVADLEGEFAGNEPSDLVTVVVQTSTSDRIGPPGPARDVTRVRRQIRSTTLAADVDHLHATVPRLRGLVGRGDKQPVNPHPGRLHVAALEMKIVDQIGHHDLRSPI
jgi:hypothetical protein